MEISSAYRRENIILHTIDIIGEYGVHSVSTKEIARRLGVSETTIFRYFPKKTDLFNAVLEHYSQYDDDIFHSAKLNKLQPRESIIFYIDFYMAYYENYPAITAITQAYDTLKYIPELEEKVKNIFSRRLRFMSELIADAQAAGVICKEVDSDSLADILDSTCRGMCLKWRMCDFSFPLREKALNAAITLLDAFNHK